MNRHIANIRKFKRGLFTISVDAYEEPDLDLSFDTNGETRTEIEQGRLTPFCVKASLAILGHELASDYLGNCIYKTPSDFMDHIGIRIRERAESAKHHRTIRFGSYFHDMVSNVIRDGRDEAATLLTKLQTTKLRTTRQCQPSTSSLSNTTPA